MMKVNSELPAAGNAYILFGFEAIQARPNLDPYSSTLRMNDETGQVFTSDVHIKHHVRRGLKACAVAENLPHGAETIFYEKEDEEGNPCNFDLRLKKIREAAGISKPDMKDALSANVNNAVEEYRLASYDIKGLKQILEDVRVDVPVSTYTMDDSGQEKITSSEVYMIVSLVLSVIIYMFIAMFSAMVMQSVIEEKSTRVVEVLISSVNSLELMFGKIVGVAAVALTQFFLWIVLTAVIVLGVGSFIGMDAVTASASMQGDQMTMMAEGLGVDPSMMDQTGMTVSPDMLAASSDSELSAVMSTLAGLNYGEILLCFVIYFVLGYLLYASLFAAIGSAVENEADTQQLQMPVTIPLLLAFFIAFYAFKAPDSQVVFWGSIIPFTSPIVMLARIPFGVPFWELALSVGLLLLTFVAMAYISAKIYKVGILMYGKKTTFKDLYKWLKQK